MIASAIFPSDFFGESETVKFPNELDAEKHSMLVLWGGEDISSSWYKQKGIHTRATDTPSKRDVLEVGLAKEARKQGIPILGICRGAQLICALDGGSLWQHVSNHTHEDHAIVFTDEMYPIVTGNSCHHQMMIPLQMSRNLVLATTKKALSPLKYKDSFDPVEDLNPEPEIVWFGDWRCVAVQGHPEWMDRGSEFNNVLRDIIDRYMGVTL